MFKLTDKNMKKSAKLWMVILFLFTGAGRVTAQIPSTRIYDGEKLAKVKARMESKEYASATTKLMNEADKALKNKPVSVMDKTMVAGSGDKSLTTDYQITINQIPVFLVILTLWESEPK